MSSSTDPASAPVPAPPPSQALSPTPDAPPTRPQQLNKKPSWIGKPPPPRPATPSTMKQEVRLSYRSKGLRPPVYVVTSLSEPEWEPMELHSTVLENKELEFWRAFEVDEGEYQYKYRLGPGDWWALDESKPIVDDGEGNRNNVVTIQAPKQQPLASVPALPPTLQITEQHSDAINALGISNAAPVMTTSPQKPPQVRLGPADPLTPPMTPEMSQELAIDAGKFQPFPVPAIEIQSPDSVASMLDDNTTREAQPVSSATTLSDFTTHDDGPKTETGVLARFKFAMITLGTWMINLCGGGMRATGIVALAVGLAAVAYKVRDVRSAVFPAVFSAFYPQTFRKNGTDASNMV